MNNESKAINIKKHFSNNVLSNICYQIEEKRKFAKSMKQIENGEYMSLEESKKRINQKYANLHL